MSTFNIKVAPDKLAAYLIIQAPKDDYEVIMENIKAFLSDKNIVYGLIEDNIKKTIENSDWDNNILVAEGIKPVQGKDGSVKYTFDPDPGNAPKEREDGSLDFHNLNKIQNISAGEKLADLVLPVEGEPGTDVFGNSVKPDKVKAAKILKGKNTQFNDERTILLAEIDGVIMLRADGTIEVSSKINIDGDIDLSTGNMEVKGDLVVRGDVKTGFKISASGDIEIGGTIEDAQITAGGSVNVKGGFVGEGHGFIRAGGDVTIKFINRQRIEADGNIEIFEEAVGSQLTTAGSIFAKKGKGIIAGGVINAAIAIEANTLGTPQNVSTDIIVGDISKLLEIIAGRIRECEGLNEKIDGIAKKMEFLMKKKKKVGLTTQDEELFKKLDKLSADIDLTINTFRKEVKSAEETIENLKKTAYIKVIKIVFPGVTLKIAGSVKYYENEREATTFKVYNGDIIGMEEVGALTNA